MLFNEYVNQYNNDQGGDDTNDFYNQDNNIDDTND